MRSAHLLPLSVAALARCSVISSSSNTEDTTNAKYLLITGDSYTTTGFNASINPQPSFGDPMGNPAYPGVTLSGGENWLDILVYNCSNIANLLAYNYAVGGNTVNISETQDTPSTTNDTIDDMTEQVDEMERLVATTSTGFTSSHSLSINWFGINDIFGNGLYTNRTYNDATKYLTADIEDYYGQLQRIYNLGVRQFITILIPPASRSPVVSALNDVQLAQNLTVFWNTEIEKQNSHSHFRLSNADAQSSFYDPCLWHDFIHPGLVIQKAIGPEICQHVQGLGFFDETQSSAEA